MTHLFKSIHDQWNVSAALATAEAKLGENLKVNLILSRQDGVETDITHLVRNLVIGVFMYML